jgi:hypothetical protein
MLGRSCNTKSRGTSTSWLPLITPTAYDDTGSSTWLDLCRQHERGTAEQSSQVVGMGPS